MSSAQIHEDPNRTAPLGIVRYANEYLEAAVAANTALGAPHDIAAFPVMFLVGQSIELVLKAYLLHQGVSLRDIKKVYGHELRRSLKKARELGLSSHVALTPQELAALHHLDHLYATKQLQYIVTGMQRVPAYSEIANISSRLLRAIGPLVGFPVQRVVNVAPRRFVWNDGQN